MKRVGVIGYGHLGQFFVTELNRLEDFEVVRIWNRTADESNGILPLDQIVEKNLSDLDFVIEVAHPALIREYAAVILKNYGSHHNNDKKPSSFKLESTLKETNERAKLESEMATILSEAGHAINIVPFGNAAHWRQICNVNTMAKAATAAHSLGFDGVTAKLSGHPKA